VTCYSPHRHKRPADADVVDTAVVAADVVADMPGASASESNNPHCLSQSLRAAAAVSVVAEVAVVAVACRKRAATYDMPAMEARSHMGAELART